MKGASPRTRATLASIGAAGLLLAVAVARADAPGDIRFEHPSGSMVEAAVFPHWVHRLRFTCNACHPALFPMARTLEITMDEINSGKLCGACHNGRVGFAVTATTCNRCHLPPEP